MSLRERFADRFNQRWADRIEQIASEELAMGATAADLKQRVERRLRAETQSRPLLDFLLRLLEELLPTLIQLLIGGLLGGMAVKVDAGGEGVCEESPPENSKAFAMKMPDEATAQLQSVARALNIDYWRLLECLGAAVGWKKMWDCVRANPRDWMSCAMKNVDVVGLVTCALSVDDSGGGNEFES